MSEEPKGYEPKQIKAAISFAIGEITLEELEGFQPTGKGKKWKHMKYIKNHSFLWYQLLEELPVHYRLKALLDSEELSIDNLDQHMLITNAEDYINKKDFLKNLKGIPNTLLKLAILFDVPLRFIIGLSTNVLGTSIFEEYDYLIQSERKEISELIEWTIEHNTYRNVQGFIIDNSKKELPFINNNKAYVRVDKNETFFRFEIFLVSNPFPNYNEIKQILKYFKGLIKYVFKEDCVLRNMPKLTLIGTYSYSAVSDVFENYISGVIKQHSVKQIYPYTLKGLDEKKLEEIRKSRHKKN